LVVGKRGEAGVGRWDKIGGVSRKAKMASRPGGGLAGVQGLNRSKSRETSRGKEEKKGDRKNFVEAMEKRPEEKRQISRRCERPPED